MPSFLARFTSQAEPDWIAPEDLAPHLSGEAPPLIIDVRGPAEFTGPLGHIGGARNLPLDQVPAATEALKSETRPLVLICHTDRRSAAAAHHLRGAGIADVSVVRGGMVAWHQLGLSAEYDPG